MSKGIINSPELYESTAIPKEQKDRLRVAGKELAIGEDYDRIDVTYPSTTTEKYDYSKDAVNILSILVTYLTAAKKDISSVEVV